MYRTATEYSVEGLLVARDYERCLSSKCHHVSNDDYYGAPFLLEEFQRENMWKPVFACGQMEDGVFRRRHRRAIFGLPSGYGKTEIAAAMVLTIATMEVVHNGQYGVVASSLEQVDNIFSKIATMIKLDEDWNAQWEIGKKVITHRETGARIMVLPNKASALESWHFNVLIFDELHVYRDSKVWDAGIKAQKVIPGALTIGITTASDQRKGFLWDLLKSSKDDPGTYVYWLGLDDDADIDKEESWAPLMCASWVTWDTIQDQRNSATSKRSFERYTANRFPLSMSHYACFTTSQIAEISRRSNRFDMTKPFTIGIDGATSGDSFAIVAYQERKTTKGKTVCLTREWIFDEPDEESGTYDMQQIMGLVSGIYQQHYPRVVGIDPNRLIVMASSLKEVYGVEVVAFAQNNPTMCQACSIVVNKVKSKELRLRGCEKLQAHMANAVEVDREPWGTRFGKESKDQKIDGAIALAIAALAYEKLVKGTEDMVPVC